MDNEDWGLTWDECIDRFQQHINYGEELKRKSSEIYEQSWRGTSQLNAQLPDLIEILEKLRDDPEIPEVGLIISHMTLRMWLRESSKFEVHIIPIKKGILYVGLSGYEDVAVSPEQAVVTIKHYLKEAQKFESVHHQTEKDEIGEIEKKLVTLPLEWVAPAALNQIFEKALKYGGHKYILKEKGSLPLDTVKQMIDTLEEITRIVLKANDVAREKRSKLWLEQLKKMDEDEKPDLG
jgi:hypothetical protein